MENENMIIEEAVVAEGEEIIIEEVPTDAIDVVVEDEGDASDEPIEEIVGEIVDETAEETVEEELEDVAEEEEVEEDEAFSISRKCQEVKDACCNTIDRIVYDLKETNFNPYIKQTRITRVEIFRDRYEEQPIDTFETTDVKSYSAKALLAATAATALLVFVSGKAVRKFLK